MEEKLNQILSQVSNLNMQFENLSTISATPANTSVGTQVLLSIIPLVALTLGAVLFFFFLLWQYKLRKILIDSKQYDPNSIKNIKILSLLLGINGVLLGMPLCLVLYFIDGINYSLLGGLIPLFLGVGMLIFYFLIRQFEAK